MKKKLLAIFLVLVMVFGLVPATILAADDEPDEPYGNISLLKLVDNEEVYEIAFWLMFIKELDVDEIEEIFDDITFDIHYSNADGDPLGQVDGATGKLEDPDSSLITFTDDDGDPFAFASGWYLIVENLGAVAGEYLLQGDDLLIYFNAVSGFVTANETGFAADARFTIAQFYENGYSRAVQAVYKHANGSLFALRQSPKLDIPGGPNGGGALDANKFIATDNKGNEYISFCADSGAVGVRGEFVIDESNRGFSDEQMKWLIAAMDYIYTEYDFEEFEYRAIAQLIVWNMILEYSDGIAISDLWLREKTVDEIFYKYYTDQFGELIKFEAANYGTVAKFWNDPAEANALVNAILADPDYYLELYEDRVDSGTERYVGDAYFLKGDPESLTDGRIKAMMYEDLNIYQQRQLIITFNDPVAFVNPPNDVEIVGNINIKKMVDENGKLEIGAWLSNLPNLTPIEIDAILADITFKIFYSNAAGDEIAEVDGVTGKIESVFTSQIIFTNEDDSSHDFPSGWYLVHEELGALASKYFNQVPDLHFYFNAISGVLIALPKEFEPGTTFTIDQNWEKENTRPVHALYLDSDGVYHYLRMVPKLDIPDSPYGGGALCVSKFIATDDKGNDYISFCADNGAVGVEGKYVVDESNQGLSDEEMAWLVAAMDYIYAEYSFTDFENVAIAQLIVWNMLLEYSDGIALSNLWLRDREENGVYYKYYTDQWGDLIKIEAENYDNGAEYWGDPAAVNALVSAILADPGYYLNRYNARIAAGAAHFIQQAVFLKGDPDTLDPKHAGMDYEGLNIYQQRQLILVPNEPVTFDNEPGGEKVALINLLKNVNSDELYPIVYWLMFEEGFDLDEIEEILSAITFEIYYSNALGENLGQVVGVTGKVEDYYTSMITFTNPDDSAHEFESGWYLVKEVMGDKAKEVFKDNIPDLLFYFDAEAISSTIGPDTDEEATFDNEPLPLGGLRISAGAILKTSEGEYTEYWQGERTPYKYYKQSSEGSVTATNDVKNPTVVPHSNHFCYATLNRAALEEGITLDLVVGNKIDKVGEVFVQLVDGKIVITFPDNVVSTDYGAVASDEPFTKQNNGNVHAGNNNYGFKKSNQKELVCPAGDVVYLYIHGDFKFNNDITHTKPGYDPQTGYVWVEKAPVLKCTEYGDPIEKTTSLDVFIKVYSPSGDLVAEFTLNGNKATTGAKTLSDLLAGVYTVKWTFDYADDVTVYDGTIEVKAGETVKFGHIFKEYTEDTVWTEADDSPIILPPIINPVVIVK